MNTDGVFFTVNDAIKNEDFESFDSSVNNDIVIESESNFLLNEFDMDLHKVKNLDWVEDTSNYSGKHFSFLPNPSIFDKRLSEFTPYQLFTLIFDDNIVNEIIVQTNLYAEQFFASNTDYFEKYRSSRLKKWKQVTKEEIMTFIGLDILMGIHSNSTIEDNWSINPLLKTNFGDYMSYNRYLMICKFFHLGNNCNEEIHREDKLKKVRVIKEKLIHNWKKLCNPYVYLSIDELLLPFTGRLNFIQYMKDKRNKWGIKIFILASSPSGYVLNIKIYDGKDYNNKSDIPLAIRTISHLLSGYENRGYVLYADNWYSSISLLNYIEKKGFYYTGTIRKERIKSKDLKNIELQSNQSKFFTCKDYPSLLLTVYQDVKLVFLISNWDFPTHQDGFKPTIIQNYNRYMRSVDLSNQYCEVYRFPHRSRKWWKVIYHYLLEVSISNCFIIYNYFHERKMSHKDFIIEILNEILKVKKIKRKSQLHFPEYIDEQKMKSKRQKCRRCSSLTYYECKKCSNNNNRVYLCVPNCYKIYHNN